MKKIIIPLSQQATAFHHFHEIEAIKAAGLGQVLTTTLRTRDFVPEAVCTIKPKGDIKKAEMNYKLGGYSYYLE